MSKFLYLLLIMTFTVLTLSACGISADVHDAVVAEKEAAQASVAQLQKEKEAAQASVAQSEKENRTLVVELGSIKADLTQAEVKVLALGAVYPPKRFKDRADIETWLRNDDISERAISLSAEALLSKALEQQARALEDGYIVSAEYVLVEGAEYLVWVSAVAENSNYFTWDVQTDEVVFGSNINQLPLE